MKKLPLTFGIIIAVLALVVFINKLYYPPLPIADLSAKEAIDSLQETDGNLVQIAKEGDTIWFITRNGEKGILAADENIKQLLQDDGWEFKEKEGGGLIFEKGGNRLIATTQMWTKNYVLVKIPEF